MIIFYFLFFCLSNAFNIQRQKLVKNNYKLVPYYINKKYNSFPKYIKEELTQVGYIGLIKASEKYDDSYNNTFGTYAYYYICGYACNYLRKIKKQKTFESNMDFQDNIFLLKDKKQFNYEENDYNKWIILSFFNQLDLNKKRKLFYEYYFLHKTQKELSKKYNINRNTISSLFKKEIQLFKQQYLSSN